MSSRGCSSCVRFQGGDELYFVGRPACRAARIPSGVLQLFRSTKARGVRGNHEETLLKWHRAHQSQRAVTARASGVPTEARAPARRVKIGRCSNRSDLWIDLPDHQLRIVHAGVIPGVPMRRATARSAALDALPRAPQRTHRKRGHRAVGIPLCRAAPRRLRSQRAARAAAASLGHRPRHRCGLRRTSNRDGARGGARGPAARPAQVCLVCVRSSEAYYTP